jgi:AcrR family transcriptional regulator
MNQPNRANRKELSRDRILDVASRAVRRKGFHGIGIADVMKEAGLTHGGFYAHFDSRDDLLQAALARANVESAAFLENQIGRLTQAGVAPFRAWVETYLHEDGLNNRETGCPVAALSSEMPEQCDVVRDASQHLVRNLQRGVQRALAGSPHADAAWSVTSALVGALQMARTLGDNDEGRAVLAATRRELLARYGGPAAGAGAPPDASTSAR